MNKFGDKSWEMPGNMIEDERRKTSGQGYDASTFVCPAGGYSRQSSG